MPLVWTWKHLLTVSRFLQLLIVRTSGAWPCVPAMIAHIENRKKTESRTVHPDGRSVQKLQIVPSVNFQITTPVSDDLIVSLFAPLLSIEHWSTDPFCFRV